MNRISSFLPASSHPHHLYVSIASTAGEHKKSRNEDGLGDLALLVSRPLERLSWDVAEAVQIQAIVPIGPANQWQCMRSQTLQRVFGAAAH
jgi:hypothetical protein